MGGLRKYMPITYWTDGDRLAGAVPASRRSPASSPRTRSSRRCTCRRFPGHGYAYFAVMAGVFVTAFYSFRMLFLAFHGEERFDAPMPHAPRTTRTHAHDEHDGHHGGPPKESPWVVTVPLILLAIPSVYAGWTYIEPMLFGDYFGDSIVVRREHAGAGASCARSGTASARSSLHGVLEPAVLAGARRHRRRPGTCYLVNPALPARIAARRSARSTRCSTTSTTSTGSTTGSSPAARARVGGFLSNVGDRTIIDGFFVNGSARVVGWARRCCGTCSPATSTTTRSR